MASKVLVIPDKLKGTLTAQDAASRLARGWLAARPDDVVELLPMSDGGDGFGEIIGHTLGARRMTVKTVDAAHRPCDTPWWLVEDTKTAVVESAGVIGLAMLPGGKYHPFELDTEGLGIVLVEALNQGARRCLLGIGGSATNDAGFGMAKALGWKFGNLKGEKIERWTELHTLREISPPINGPRFEELIVAVDVQNPLLGPQGCCRVYGPQKGLKADDFHFAERCLQRLVEVMKSEGLPDHSTTPGAGAAGGLGFGLLSFAGAKLQPGFKTFADSAGLEDKLRGTDLVLTAEGALDQQTLMGKGVGELAQWCRRKSIPCVALAGAVTEPERAKELFQKAYAMAPDFVSREEAMAQAGDVLERLAKQAASEWAGPSGGDHAGCR